MRQKARTRRSDPQEKFLKHMLSIAKSAAKGSIKLARKRVHATEAELDAQRTELLQARAMASLLEGIEDGLRDSLRKGFPPP